MPNIKQVMIIKTKIIFLQEKAEENTKQKEERRIIMMHTQEQLWYGYCICIAVGL
jgi:hypothetical protein